MARPAVRAGVDVCIAGPGLRVPRHVLLVLDDWDTPFETLPALVVVLLDEQGPSVVVVELQLCWSAFVGWC